MVLAPLVVAFAPPRPASRQLLIEVAVGFGFVALAMLALQLVLSARFQFIAPSAGMDAIMRFHRRMGITCFVLVLLHVAVLIAANPRYAAFLDPSVSVERAAALWVAALALFALVSLSIYRRRISLSYEWWRRSHSALAGVVVLVGLVHVLRVGHYVEPVWKQTLWILLTGIALMLLGYVRLIRPALLLRKPYRVVSVQRERGRAWTLTVSPENHRGIRFIPGQFAWVSLGASPYTMNEHPFSFSSSAERPDKVQFTVKELGDFTNSIGLTRVGEKLYIDGPFGAFTPGRRDLFLIAGGVGISPMMSIIRTIRDRGDERRIKLLYGASSRTSLIFLEELEGADIEFVPVVEEEMGLMSDEIIRKNLPDNLDAWDFLVCGPPAMMDLAEKTLHKAGVSPAAIKSERFDLV